MEFAVLGLFCGILILCIVCNVSIIYALLAGFVIFGCYAKKKGLFGKRDPAYGGRGNLESQKHPDHLYADRNADRTLETGRNDPGDHLLYDPFYKTIGFSSDGISFELAGFGADRNFVRDGGNSRRCLCDDGILSFRYLRGSAVVAILSGIFFG